MRPRVWLAAILICLLQTGAIATIIGGRAVHLARGREIVVSVVPVDPRDLLRGDYVRMNYSISTLPSSLVHEPEGIAQGTPVFVTLERQGQPEEAKWAAVAISTVRPTAPEADDKVVLRGITQWWWRESGIRVAYGIESYFVQEDTGHDLEKATREGTVKAVISVGRDGNAAIKGLIVAGKRHDETLY
jgi:uncharacterized membrane-anchored protein